MTFKKGVYTIAVAKMLSTQFQMPYPISAGVLNVRWQVRIYQCKADLTTELPRNT